MTKKTRREIDAALKAKIALESGAGARARKRANARSRSCTPKTSAEVRKMSTPDRRGMLDRANQALSTRRQCMLLGIARSCVYRPLQPANDNDLALMQRIDELFTALPFLDSRRITAMLKAEGLRGNRKRVQRLMRRLGIAALGPKPNTTKPAPGPQDLSLSAAQHGNRPAEPGVGGRHHVSAHRPRLSLSRRHHRLSEPCGSGVAAVEYDGRSF
ncbi:hypothetical protein ACVWW6_008910 [Bradyrhizobium sp. USDA 3311]